MLVQLTVVYSRLINYTPIKAKPSRPPSSALRDMRLPQELPVDTVQEKAQVNTTVPSTASLRVTMTNAYQPKQHKSAFRVVERPDGVIVEHPSYCTSLPTLTSERHFQTKPVILPVPTKSLKPTAGARASNNKCELLGIGAFADDTMRVGEHGSTTSGRGGYNVLADNTEEPESVVEDAHCGIAPMERFLMEAEFWSPLSRRSG